jgi:catechol 2,3-dioxygenase-like lactoylglutathione lyase family enzyme
VIPIHRNEGGCIVDYKLELVLLPVSDVDRAKAFYTERVGFTGPDPERHDYASFADFADRDGNTWILQEGRSEQGA